MRRTTLFAVVASALMLLSVAGPAVADDIDTDTLSVSVTQADSGEATVSVTGSSNNSSVDVAGANVTVEVLDANTTYEGSGDYVTDENGTVTLPAPNETVNVSVTASYENQSATTEVTLEASEEEEGGNATAFGQQVSSFVHDLQSSNNTSDAPLGVLVAQFVIANNPGNAPDHAGPPAWLLNDSVNKTTGPPAHAGPPENNSGGPPENKTTGPSGDKGGGPPDDKGKDATETDA